MKDLSNRSTIAASASRATHGSGSVAGHRRTSVATPDAMADIYSHLRWIGPGTFLVAAYIHKRLRG